ncbi:hypothetical protein M9Y10_013597 [Tritrichomonas musculus]|uniref:Uncharacterized protein n=1 Tax=Tritrichomonas musculus TaxID=1915356 RepID=A0ABR2KXY1_9EUKA
MNTRLLSSLIKSEILSLPGFDRYKSYTVKQLKLLLKKKIKDLGIDYRGVRVFNYIDRYNKIQRSEDDELFKRISSNKESLKKQRQSRESYKRSLRDTALFERSLMNMNPIYSNTSSKENKEFVKSLMNMNPIYSDPSKLNKEFVESFMNIDTGYTSSKTEERRHEII